MKICRTVAFLVLFASGVASAQEQRESPFGAFFDEMAEACSVEEWKADEQLCTVRLEGIRHAKKVIASGDAAQESANAAYRRVITATGDRVAAEAAAKAAADQVSAVAVAEEAQAEREVAEWQQRQLEFVAGSLELTQRAEAEAARKAASDAQLQAHMQQVAARKSQEWQNQLWLWQAQGEAWAQQQYQQQLLHELRRQEAGQFWLRLDLQDALRRIAAPPANCWYSHIQKRHVCY